MSFWYEDDEERFERITSDNEEAARDAYYERLENRHALGDHDDEPVEDCPDCQNEREMEP